jgi:hypothetical protein
MNHLGYAFRRRKIILRRRRIGSFNEFIKRILRKKENFADEVMAKVKG